MTEYLLIESRDPFESNDLERYCGLAVQLKRAGHDVALFLVQNGVMAVRGGVRTSGLDLALKANVRVLADDFSLRERGIPLASVIAGVSPAPIEVVIERLAAGCKAIWH